VTRNWIRALACVALASAALATSCASKPDDSSEPRLVLGPVDPTTYETMVQPVFERRCGSIDCHGQLPRGLRVYGANGLRLPNDKGLVPGGGATTHDETYATYASIVALQPDRMNAFLLKTSRTPGDAYDLIVLSKALAIERHRGGPSLNKGEAAEQCIVRWLLGQPAQDLCTAGARPP
jgi:hypothetical protein